MSVPARRLLIGFTAGLFTLADPWPARGDEVPGADLSADCGPQAAYVLLKLRGHGVPLGKIMQRLGAPPDGGYSMGDLQRVTGDLGLTLHGARIDLPSSPLRQAAIAYLRRGDHGHFVVLRPVGHTGRLVQVLDSISHPVVLDREELTKVPGWTGVVLMPSRGFSLATGAGLLLLTLGLGRLVLTYRRRRSPARLAA